MCKSFVGLVSIVLLTAGCVADGLPRGPFGSCVDSGSSGGLLLLLLILGLVCCATAGPLPKPLDEAGKGGVDWVGAPRAFAWGGLVSSGFLFFVPLGLKSLSSGIKLNSIFQPL